MAERATREIWAKRVKGWTDSDLTAKEFGAETGLNAGTLQYWKSKLKRDTNPRKERSQRRRRTRARAAFIEIKAQTSERVGPAAPFVLWTADGKKLEIPASFDSAALQRLLAALEGG